MNIPIPKPRTHKSRLTAEAKNLQPQQNVICSSDKSARCVRAYGKRKGWVVVQQKDGEHIRVWRLS